MSINKYFCKNLLCLPLLQSFGMTIAEIILGTAGALFPFPHCQNSYKLSVSEHLVLQNSNKKSHEGGVVRKAGITFR